MKKTIKSIKLFYIVLILLSPLTLYYLVSGIMEVLELSKTSEILRRGNTKSSEQVFKDSKKNLKLANQVKLLEAEKIILLIHDKKKLYFDKIQVAIMSFYYSHGQNKDKTKVRGLIETAFATGEEIDKKGCARYYGKTAREIALNLLAEIQKETDFDIYDEFFKSRNKNGSYDFGAWQINDCHWTKGEPTIYTIMTRLKLWDMKADKWICDPHVNSVARVIIVNDRLRQGLDYNRNDTLLKILDRVDGWNEVYN